jgi:hypothetical protein
VPGFDAWADLLGDKRHVSVEIVVQVELVTGGIDDGDGGHGEGDWRCLRGTIGTRRSMIWRGKEGKRGDASLYLQLDADESVLELRYSGI